MAELTTRPTTATVRRATSKLCSSCQRFDIHRFRSLPDDTEVIRVAALAKTAAAGCDFWQFLHEIAKEYYAVIDRQDDFLAQGLDLYEKFWLRLSCLGSGSLPQRPLYNKLWVSISNIQYLFENPRIESLNPIKFDYEICIAAGVESAAYRSGAVAGRYMGQNRAAPEYMAALKQWIEDCISSHPQCRRTISDPSGSFDPHDVELPTRCVEVKKGGSYLRYTSGLTGCYITLSHRWNVQGSACKTTASNYDVRIEGQNLEASADFQLSKTFSDAISVARALEIQYIWIDSLCIIQNSDDVPREMWKMGRYYQHSIFTIAAINVTSGGASRDSSLPDGFLEISPAASISRIIRLPYREKKIQRGYLYVYKRNRNVDLQYMQDVDQSELLSRGWVFQEWRLSRRIVYFSENETFMECESRRPVSICNDEVRNNRERNTMSEAGKNVNKLFWNGMKYGSKAELNIHHGSILDSWYWCCKVYSSSNLTVKSDRLAAISGIAGEYASLLDHNSEDKGKSTVPSYLSGLWHEDIHHGLLWIGRDIAPRCFNKCKTGGAPSWSWMSFGSLVSWPNRHTGSPTVPALEVVGATAEEAHGRQQEQMTVMVTQLTVRAKVLPVLVRAQLVDVKTREVLAKATGTQLIIDRPGMAFKKTYQEKYYAVCSSAAPEVIAGWATFERLRIPDTATPTNSETVVPETVVSCLHVATRKNVGAVQMVPGVFQLGHDVYEVLFVEPTGRGSFRRIGMGMVLDRIIKDFELVSTYNFLAAAGVENSRTDKFQLE